MTLCERIEGCSRRRWPSSPRPASSGRSRAARPRRPSTTGSSPTSCGRTSGRRSSSPSSARWRRPRRARAGCGTSSRSSITRDSCVSWPRGRGWATGCPSWRPWPPPTSAASSSSLCSTGRSASWGSPRSARWWPSSTCSRGWRGGSRPSWRVHRGLGPAALRWWTEHADVDVQHAAEGLADLEDLRALLRAGGRGRAGHRRADPARERVPPAVLPGKRRRSRGAPAGDRGHAMRLVSATVYALRIPFLTSVRHSLAGRAWSDSVVVRVWMRTASRDSGRRLRGPTSPVRRPADVVEHLAQVLWPAVCGAQWPDLASPADLEAVERLVPDAGAAPGRHHAARAALELALVDCGAPAPGRLGGHPASAASRRGRLRRGDLRGVGGAGGRCRRAGRGWPASARSRSRSGWGTMSPAWRRCGTCWAPT